MCDAAGTEALSEFNKIARIRYFAAGRTIISAQEPLVIVGNILSGIVKLTRNLIDGREQIVSLLFASDFIGRAFSQESLFSAEAATDVELCAFEKKAFDQLLLKYPAVERHLLISTTSELEAAREWMTILGTKSSLEKVASFMLFLATRLMKTGQADESANDKVMFALPISRSEMACFLGITVETVSRQITALKTKGIIQFTDIRHFVVPDMARLAEAASADYIENSHGTDGLGSVPSHIGIRY